MVHPELPVLARPGLAVVLDHGVLDNVRTVLFGGERENRGGGWANPRPSPLMSGMMTRPRGGNHT